MGTISLSIPQAGQPDSTEEPKIVNDLTLLQTLLNGNLDTNNLHPSRAGITLAQLGTAVQALVSIDASASVVGGAGQPTFASGWSAGSSPPRFWKSGSRVYLAGIPTGNVGASGTSVFTLPAGYRPTSTYRLTTSDGATIRFVTVNTDGTVVASAPNLWLDGVSFDVSR